VKKEKDVDLRIHLPIEDDGFSLSTDAHRLKQIMMNLLGNALKFTKSGYVEFGYIVEGELIDNDKTHLTFFVKDTGIGIPEDEISSIFDRTSINENIENQSGIGLCLTKRLVELLGGRITVSSVLGKGTTFKFSLPYIPRSNSSTEVDISDNSIPNWKSKIILVAEDEEINYKFIIAALKKTGITILRAKDGEEAIEILKEKHSQIDLVLMDMQMPKLNGFDATRIIKKNFKNIPVIAQTAFTLAGGKIKCFEAGCDGYISKPYKGKELIEIMSKHF